MLLKLVWELGIEVFTLMSFRWLHFSVVKCWYQDEQSTRDLAGDSTTATKDQGPTHPETLTPQNDQGTIPAEATQMAEDLVMTGMRALAGDPLLSWTTVDHVAGEC